MTIRLDEIRSLIKEMYVDHAGAFVPTGDNRVETVPPDPADTYDKDDLYHAVMDAKRVLENLPLQHLPEDISHAIEYLRKAVDAMPAPENYDRGAPGPYPDSAAAYESDPVDNRSASVNRYIEE